jgi:1-deoxy-D-xylulose-5-phosphate reductoisomerase
MENTRKHLAILGSTGSIGTQALDVIEANKDLFVVEVLTANSNSELLIQQALQYKPNAVVIANESKYDEVKNALNSTDIKVYARAHALTLIHNVFFSMNYIS